MHNSDSSAQINNTQDPPILKIKLFGGFDLRYQDKVISTVNTSRLQSLMAYLVLHKETPLSRQQVAFLFWPETTEAQARTNLRNLLHKLRSALPEADRYLLVDQHTMQWQSSAYFSLDVDEFLSLVNRPASIQSLKAVVQIYSGDLMPGCYDEWAQTLREDLRQSYLLALEKLLLRMAEGKSWHEAVHYAQILLRHDPIREETYQHLMRLYAQLGDRASVARIYKTCVIVLEQELGVKPSPATDEAYRKWIAHETESFHPETDEVSPQDYVAPNLPASLTSFIGRQQELEEVKALLSRHRLVSLMGPGGIGKTRLALAVAAEMLSKYRDGVYLVDMALVSDPGMITAAIADVLHTSDEVRVAGLDGLIKHLSDQNLLLLLDNCEQLAHEIGTAALALLNACPEITILTTSRVALKVYGEAVWPVPALPTPLSIDKVHSKGAHAQTRTWLDNESVQLFIERATSTLPTFTATPEALLLIAEICRRLDGIPLAIEMAAARVKTLSVEQIVQRLDNALGLLKHSQTIALPRHQTMEAVLDWSYTMLAPAERELFARLSVFSSDFSLEAAEQICSGDGIGEEEILDLLASLVDQSLVGTMPSLPEARFRIHEINRQYIHRKLRTQEDMSQWYEHFLGYFLSLAEEAEPELRGGGQLEWLDRLDREQENLRAALAQALEEKTAPAKQHVEDAGRLVTALWFFWQMRGRLSEGRRWAEQTLSALERTSSSSLIPGKVLYTAASFCYFQGDYSRAKALSQKSLTVCKSHGDGFGEIVSQHHLGLVAIAEGDLAQAGKHLYEALETAIHLGNLWLLSGVYEDLAHLAVAGGDLDSALGHYQQSLSFARQGRDKFFMLFSLLNIATLAFMRGDLQQAATLAEESLSLSRLLREKRGISYNLNLLGCIAMQEGQHQRADELLKESVQILWSTRDRENIIRFLVDLADNAARQERFQFAARLAAACEAALASFPAGYRLYNQAIIDRLVNDLPAELGEGTFTAAWTLGKLMTLEQAVSYALLDHPKHGPD